jgi:hypothetical protein
LRCLRFAVEAAIFSTRQCTAERTDGSVVPCAADDDAGITNVAIQAGLVSADATTTCGEVTASVACDDDGFGSTIQGLCGTTCAAVIGCGDPAPGGDTSWQPTYSTECLRTIPASDAAKLQFVRPTGSPADGPNYFDLWRTAQGYPWDKFTFLGTVAHRDQVSWHAAAAACDAAGLALASVMKQAEADVLSTMGARSWIGLHDVANDDGTTSLGEGKFSWATGEPVVYTNWNTGEPNDAGPGEDCVEIRGDGTWNDHKCNDRMLYAMCSPKWTVPDGAVCDLPYDEDKSGTVDINDILGALSYYNLSC